MFLSRSKILDRSVKAIFKLDWSEQRFALKTGFGKTKKQKQSQPPWAEKVTSITHFFFFFKYWIKTLKSLAKHTTLSRTREDYSHLVVAELKYLLQRLILYNTLNQRSSHISQPPKLKIFLYKSTEYLLLHRNTGDLFFSFFMSTTDDKADYIVTFWFGSTA